MDLNTYAFFIISLMISLGMIFFGNKYMSNPPEEISYSNGYCTKKSTKNKDTWLFAQKKFGKIWHISGIFILTLSILTMFLIYKESSLTIFITGTIIFCIQGLLMISPLLFVEKSLKDFYDEDGNRRVR